MERPRVVVVGAGPGGLAATRRLAATGRVGTTLVHPDGVATYLAGIVPLLLGTRPATDYRRPIMVEGVRMRTGTVVGVEPGRVDLTDGTRLDADAIVVAPGLATEIDAIPSGTRSRAVWDLAGAEASRAALKGLEDLPAGRAAAVVVVIMGLPYRCPPAPYGLAMALRTLYREGGRDVAVALVTPEARPLVSLDGRMATFLEGLVDAHGVALHTSVTLDRTRTRDGLLVADDGRTLSYDLGLFVPPHRRPAFLADLGGTGPLVTVDASMRTSMPGVWAVGDVTATPLPRAAGVAEAQGRTAAESVLAALGVATATPPTLPVPSCYVWTGPARAARIAIRFPDGLPPGGAPDVTLTAPSAALAVEALAARDEWERGWLPNSPAS